MALHTLFITVLLTSLVLPFLVTRSNSLETNGSASQTAESDLLEFALNLDFLEAEFFLVGAEGRGLDAYAPELANGGPPPIGGRRANLDPDIKNVTFQFGLIAIGHIRSPIGLSVRATTSRRLTRPHARFLLRKLAGTWGSRATLMASICDAIVAGILGVEAGEDAVFRALLFERRNILVSPYAVTVAEFTNRISDLRNRLGREGIKDEGVVVPPSEGAEGKVSGNVLSADKYSLSYPRSIEEILRIIYGGNASVPGAFFPRGANGRLAQSYSLAT
uniref:Desiccation-related protein PCC13-62 n=1 Tax=Cajanus cajan TaxID=3821 RepID=A0A151SCR2_CAJCA|nr:Desiccation-related protein PCC13-62 [Cajanus cajan]